MANAQDSKHPASRDEVFTAISSERQYQIFKWGYRQPDGTFKEPEHGVCDYLTYMRHYLALADQAAATVAGSEAALEQLRKVVTLGVACLEQHGAKQRVFSNVINQRDGKPCP